jgi:cbb3-type cytochrome oxidase subunit 3
MRHLLIYTLDRISVLILAFGGLCALLSLKIVENQFYPDYEYRHLDMAVFRWLTIAMPMVLVFILWIIYYSNRRMVAAIADPVKHREATIARLTSLLEASGLSESEIKVWLERVPPVRPT